MDQNKEEYVKMNTYAPYCAYICNQQIYAQHMDKNTQSCIAQRRHTRHRNAKTKYICTALATLRCGCVCSVGAIIGSVSVSLRSACAKISICQPHTQLWHLATCNQNKQINTFSSLGLQFCNLSGAFNPILKNDKGFDDTHLSVKPFTHKESRYVGIKKDVIQVPPCYISDAILIPDRYSFVAYKYDKYQPPSINQHGCWLRT